MKIIPAIDLMEGQCVRLEQGSFAKVTSYSADALKVAQEYSAAGAKYLHVVDLDGARLGKVQQAELISSIIENCGLEVQVGGGIRSLQDAEILLNKGVKRLILGSICVNDAEKTLRMLKEFGAEKIIFGLDVQKNEAGEFMVATHGWKTQSEFSIWEILERYTQEGALQILTTDISRDGMLSGTNEKLYHSMRERFPGIQIIASGGVSSLADLVALQKIPVDAVVIGKALYENRFTLREALQC